MVKCSINKLENQKRYYQNNREKILLKAKENGKKIYSKNRTKILERAKIYASDNKEKVKEYKHNNYIQNKDRIKDNSREYYRNNVEEIRKKDIPKKRERNKIWRNQNQEYKKDYRIKNSLQFKAQSKAENNILIPLNQLCEICNKALAVDRHHEDYNKPLEVKFLCKDCHYKIHRKIITNKQEINNRG